LTEFITGEHVDLLAVSGQRQKWVNVPVVRTKRQSLQVFPIIVLVVLFLFVSFVQWAIFKLKHPAVPPVALLVAGGAFHVSAATLPASSAVLDICIIAIHGMMPAAISHVVLVLPKGKQLVTRVPGLVVFVYSIASAFIAVEVAMVFRGSRLWELPDRVLGSWSLAGTLTLVGSCYFVVIESDTVRERRVARALIVASVAFFGVLVLASVGVGEALPGAPRETIIAVLVSVLAGVALVASWHAPSDMPRIVRWVASYVLYTACVSALAYAVALVGGVLDLWHWHRLDPAMIMGLVFAGLVVTDRLRLLSWGLAEFWISPWAPRLEGARRFHAIGSGVLGSADAVLEHLARAIATGVDLPRISGYLSVGSGAWRLAVAYGEPFEAGLAGGGSSVLRSVTVSECGLRDVVHLPDVMKQDEQNLSRLREEGILTVCGLKGRDGYRGVVLLGRAHRRHVLSFDHLHFLEQLVAQSSLAIEKADLEHEVLSSTRMISLGHAAAALAHDLKRPLAEILIESRHFASRRAFGSGCGNLESIEDLARECMNRLDSFVANGRRAVGGDGGLVDLSVVLQSAVDRLRRLNPEARIVLRDSSGRPMVEDSASVQRVLENVIENAVQWSGEGESVEVAATECAGYGVVRVVDRGRGIDPGDQEYLFDPFFSRRGGSGLGLTVSREILQALGGSVDVESKAGLWTKVTVRFPISALGKREDGRR
jgi:signal transduction histidine kinase